MSTPHDALFKRAFSDLDAAKSLLRHVLPAPLAVDWDTLAVVPGSFVDEALGARHTDLLFSARVHGLECLLYTLLEHRSSGHAWMPWRLLRYEVRIWERWRRDHPKARALPPILPVVLHHGPAPWRHATDLGALVTVPAGAETALRPYLPELRFVLFDLGRLTAEDLRSLQLEIYAQVTLLALSRLRHSPNPIAELRSWLPLLRRLLRSRSGLQKLGTILEYLHQVTDPSLEDVRGVVRQIGPGVEEDYMTTLAERLRKEGHDRGLREGHDRGLREGHDRGLREGHDRGLREGRAEVLLRQARLKFGAISPELEARIREATREALDAWSERILSAHRIEDVFGG